MAITQPEQERAPSPSADLPPRVTPLPVRSQPEPTTIVALFNAEESALIGFAIGLVGRRSVAEELVQEAFMRLHELWNEVDNPRAWIYRSVRNLALNHLRDHRRELPEDSGSADKPGSDSSPDEVLGRMEAVGMVRMLVAEMPEEERELIRLKYHDDLKYHEISERTGLSVSNVGYKLHHLLKNLAHALRQAGVEGSRG